ncbi:efflux RND transporter periplasmic adaptor subunit [Azonexus sp.]|uniref:efflux RND transporter periplasmic adaptor subunit n=1 Tax=Azonexus sp. TaxID=1872668 RepID=UPI0039E6338F
MKTKHRPVLIALLAAGLFALSYVAPKLFAGASSADAVNSAAPAKTVSSPEVAVETAVVEAQSFLEESQAVGSLKANESVILRPEISGKVVRIGFRDGVAVKPGELLIALDAAIPAAELAQAQANLALARSTHQRNQELLAKKFISPQALDASAAALKVQEAAVQLAQARLGKLQLRAPFAGIVGLRDVSLGSYVKEGEALINLEDIRRLRVDFRLPETELARVRVGQNLALSSDALPGQNFSAQIAALDPQIDPEGRSIAVRARLDNHDGLLRPGMFVRVRLNFGERAGVLMVPEAAVEAGNPPSLFKIVDGKAEKVTLTLGARRAGQVEIVRGVQAGDVVVTAGQLKLRPGTPVVLPAAPASASTH